ncbi:unnamed protein product [Brachionus calyciflorus]|uniref:RING-type E3 ubiquitin transferase (cysteine targeting) n=1 Tax=Brachionus calyciflorus TaxID=104777 RepID=A0A813MY81_9BILA|nr:unnamed protein product [Brachionus calyciflorus]
MTKAKNSIPVLRVTQLDTNELDESLILTLKQSINQDFFKYVQYNFIQKYHTEIFTAIKCVLWYNTYYKRSQTIGQSLLDWSYLNQNGKLGLLRKIAHCFIYCFDEWFLAKLPHLIKKLIFYFKKLKNKNQIEEENNLDSERKIDNYLNFLGAIFKSVSFLNYLMFLFNGKYLHLWERLLKLEPSYNREQLIKSYNHEVSEREELWQTYFSIFKLIDSYASFDKIYSKITKIRSRKYQNESELNIKCCPICEIEPSMIHCSKNYDKLESCKHIYCYLCIKKALNEHDNKFECPICKKYIYDIELHISSNSGINE